MDYITIVEGAKAILQTKGVFKQVDVYRMGKRVMFKHGGGYIYSPMEKATSQPNVRLVAFDIPKETTRTSLGYLEFVS